MTFIEKQVNDWKYFFEDKSTHLSQKYLTPDTHGIMRDFLRQSLTELLEEVEKAVPPELKRQSLGNKWNLGTGEMEHYWAQSEESIEYYNSCRQEFLDNLNKLK